MSQKGARWPAQPLEQAYPPIDVIPIWLCLLSCAADLPADPPPQSLTPSSSTTPPCPPCRGPQSAKLRREQRGKGKGGNNRAHRGRNMEFLRRPSSCLSLPRVSPRAVNRLVEGLSQLESRRHPIAELSSRLLVLPSHVNGRLEMSQCHVVHVSSMTVRSLS